MTSEELSAEIRVKLGNPSVQELSNEVISYAIDSALKELGRLQPYYTYEEVDIIKGVSTYDVGSDIFDIKGFWFNFTKNYVDFDYRDIFALSGEGMPFNEYADLKVFHTPSLMNILEEKWERLHARNQHSWEFNPDTRELLIIPEPKQNGKGVYKGKLHRSIESVPDKFKPPFKDLAMAYSMDTWLFSLSMIKSIPVGVGKVDYETRGMERAKDKLREDAIRKLSSGGSAVVVG